VLRHDHHNAEQDALDMLLHGINHVATLTKDSTRLLEFYEQVFEGEIVGNSEAAHQVPMFGRGRIDHIGLRAKDLEAFDEIRRRLMERGAADAFVTDFGSEYSLFFRDPDGLEGEVLVTIPEPRTDAQTPRGTTALRYADA
jgi:catechol 2,3-dioxygenase-like lactoylglutathione lyase family enzyme